MKFSFASDGLLEPSFLKLLADQPSRSPRSRQAASTRVFIELLHVGEGAHMRGHLAGRQRSFPAALPGKARKILCAAQGVQPAEFSLPQDQQFSHHRVFKAVLRGIFAKTLLNSGDNVRGYLGDCHIGNPLN